jgi:hypothetical protein
MLGAATLLLVLLTGIAAFVAIALSLAFAVRAAIWLVLLPVKLVLWTLFLPLLLVKLFIGAILGLVFLPLLAVAGGIVALVFGAMFVIPLTPLLIVIAVVFWLIKKDRQAPALPARTV